MYYQKQTVSTVLLLDISAKKVIDRYMTRYGRGLWRVLVTNIANKFHLSVVFPDQWHKISGCQVVDHFLHVSECSMNMMSPISLIINGLYKLSKLNYLGVQQLSINLMECALEVLFLPNVFLTMKVTTQVNMCKM